MPEHTPTPDLDTRIRELVARAVADAPPAPELEPALELPPTHRPWWIGGGIALAAAAAAVVIFTLGDQDDKVSTVPATEPPVTVPTTVPATVPAAAPPSTLPPTPTGSGLIVTAGPEGVARWPEPAIITEPMAFAIDTGDGRIILQRAQGYAFDSNGQPSDPAGTAPLLIEAGSITPLWPNAAPAYVTIHDVEVVDGETLILYTSAHQPPQSLEDMGGEIAYVVPLDDPTATPVEIGQVSGWEYGVDRLHLATTGLIVGQWNSGPSHGIEIHAVPGSPAERDGLPTAESLGLPADGFGDCSNCPRSFTVTPDGASVVWVDPADDFSDSDLVILAVGGGAEQRTALGAEVAANPIAELDVTSDQLLVSSFDDPTDEIPANPPMLMDLDEIGMAATSLSGDVATFGASG